LTGLKVQAKHGVMPDETPDNTIGERVLHQVTVIKTPDGEEIKDLTVGGGDLYKWGEAMAYVPKSTEFKFTNLVKKKDALEQLQDLEEGYGL
jgi:hypothetical protein